MTNFIAARRGGSSIANQGMRAHGHDVRFEPSRARARPSTLALLMVSFAAFSQAIAASEAPVRYVVMETKMGVIEIEVNIRRAPNTSENFLRYVEAGKYDGGFFGRTVRANNQRGIKVPIAVIQAYANPARGPDSFGNLALERTRDTRLRHADGAISMARAAIDDATSEFFICIGDQPELDFGGRRHPDGQGFAAFGRVIKGMDVVRRIQASAAEGETLVPAVSIIKATVVDPRLTH